MMLMQMDGESRNPHKASHLRGSCIKIADATLLEGVPFCTKWCLHGQVVSSWPCGASMVQSDAEEISDTLPEISMQDQICYQEGPDHLL